MLRRQKKAKKGRTQRINGIPVRNAKKAIPLEVTAKDIAGARRKDPGGCAAAVAALRQIDGCADARVYKDVTYVLRNAKGKDQYYERFQTPKALRGEAMVFDRGGMMEPDVYMLQPPRERTWGHRQGSDAPSNRPPKQRPHIPANVRPAARSKEAS